MSSLPPSVAVRVVDATVDYGSVRAVDGVSLEVEPGTIHVLLGRSGSGKTTLLRAIAGFEPLATGRIELAGRTVDDGTRAGWVAPEARKIGFVFQDYALFPHLDAAGNIGFGVRGNRAARRDAANRWLDRVHLVDYAGRRPGELSGGEQQRVALARALVQEPAVVLLDEPFSNLDAHLRRSVRDETIALLRENDATAIFVTHDADEAFSVGDRLSVLHGGCLEQTGAARDLYERPASVHVARLCGPASFLPVLERIGSGRARCVLGEVEATGALHVGALLVVRPEQLVVQADDAGAARLLRRRYLGAVEELEVELSGGALVVARQTPGQLPDGATRLRVEVRAPLAAVSAD